MKQMNITSTGSQLYFYQIFHTLSKQITCIAAHIFMLSIARNTVCTAAWFIHFWSNKSFKLIIEAYFSNIYMLLLNYLLWSRSLWLLLISKKHSGWIVWISINSANNDKHLQTATIMHYQPDQALQGKRTISSSQCSYRERALSPILIFLDQF